MKRGHTHKWKLVWTNYWAGQPWATWSKAIYQCQVKRCGEMGYSC